MVKDERFDRFFKDILKHEGGYVNDPDDAGGETKYGISKRSYPSLDIAKLTKEEAKVIYYYDYWLKARADVIAQVSFQVATKYCDVAIHCGIRKAFELLKKAMEDLGASVRDGVDVYFIVQLQHICLDPQQKATLVANIIKHQKHYYHSLVAKKPSQAKFLKGWLKRAEYRGVEEWG